MSEIRMDMSHDEFMEMIDNHIQHSSYQDYEMPVSDFFELLFSTSKKRVQETFPLGARIVEGKLQFLLPTDREHTLQARGNEILVGDQLIVVTLESPCGMTKSYGTNGTELSAVTTSQTFDPMQLSKGAPAQNSSNNGASAPKVTVPINLEPDILEWFQAQGDKCQQRINAALRLYVEAHKEFSH